MKHVWNLQLLLAIKIILMSSRRKCNLTLKNGDHVWLWALRGLGSLGLEQINIWAAGLYQSATDNKAIQQWREQRWSPRNLKMLIWIYRRDWRKRNVVGIWIILHLDFPPRHQPVLHLVVSTTSFLSFVLASQLHGQTKPLSSFSSQCCCCCRMDNTYLKCIPDDLASIN